MSSAIPPAPARCPDACHGSSSQPGSRVAAKRSPLQPRLQQQRRRRGTAAALGSLQAEGPLLGLAEALGFTGDDPGHWNFSPEWYGTQGGGWGRDAGTLVFAQDSAHGNGRVTVTAHPAVGKPSSRRHQAGNGADGGAGSSGTSWEEWRVLRFNDVTRQTVMRVTVAAPEPPRSHRADGGGSSSSSPRQHNVVAQPDCLAQEYLKTTAAVAAALLGLQGLLPGSSSSGSSSDSSSSSGSHGEQAGGGQRTLRALCIGVGGGSLPLFLAHHFPSMEVDAVEIDPAVVAAATRAMGLPTDLPNLRLHCADAASFLTGRRRSSEGRQQQGRQQQDEQQQDGQQQQEDQQQQQGQQPYDIMFMDAFDGEDDVPAALCTPEFAAALGAALHPAHGCFLLNLHSLEGPHPVATFKAGLLGSMDGSSSTGSSSSSSSDGSGGACFAVAAQRQRNVCVAVARGLALPADPSAAQRCLQCEAQRAAEAAGYRFPAGSRACRQLQLL